MLYFYSFQHRRPALERNDRYMPAYYNDESKKWYCKFYYKDWQGNRKQKKKSGFERKKDALEWEQSFLEKLAGDPDMTFFSLVELYLADRKQHAKYTTYYTKKNRIEAWILPYFQNKAVNDISPADIRQWQGKLKESHTKKGTPLSPGYMKTIWNELSSIFNFAVRFYSLSANPCHTAGNIVGKVKKTVNFWTKEEFDRFTSTFDKLDPNYPLFMTLYYTGMRIGEARALTLADIDFDNNIIHINKTYSMNNGRTAVITTPKTSKGIRDILIPNFLCELLKRHMERYYKPTPDTRVFPSAKTVYFGSFKEHIKLSEVKDIRLHDLRHSHASLLIDLGFPVLLISERLGHEDPSITLKTYSHLFPSKQEELVAKLEQLFKETK